MKIRFSGREIEARPGDTVAAALYRAGQRIFSRSFKYHRPRGLLCVAGKCPNCLMNVDGIPNVRTCVTAVRDGMEVKGQNAYPSLEQDRLAIAQRFDWLMPVGWYYKTLQSSRMWHIAEPYIRRVAGLGEVSPAASSGGQQEAYEHAWMHTHTAVVGGGFAGMEAALEAAKRGEDVVLIDDQPVFGGQSCYRTIANDRTAALATELTRLPKVRLLQGCSCFGLYEGNLLGVLQLSPHPEAIQRLIHLRARHIVVATGAWETPLVFPNNDLVGVMLSSGAQRLARLHGIMPGRKAVVVGSEPRSTEVVNDLQAAGTDVIAVIAPEEVESATGAGMVTGLRTRGTHVPCDLIVVCGPLVPDLGLATQAGGRLTWNAAAEAFLCENPPPNVTIAGDAAGSDLARTPIPIGNGKRSFVCFCSDVTSQDLCDGVAEGFDQIETLKRYTTTTMGPCQGRMCQLSAVKICALETRRSPGETGVTTSRPPNPSITLGALAGPRHHPIRRTPIHHAHETSGVVWMDMGDWKRPRYYRTAAEPNERQAVEAEYGAVRNAAGMIDVSTLGKLVVRGADAGRLLDRVYTHRFSDLPVGRVRYALMCDEGGVILDDGTIARMGSDQYFVTTTTGNLDFVFQTLEWHRVGLGWRVHITNVTAGYGAINVAGPRARNVLTKLADCDLSREAFPYMACRAAMVNRARCFLLRVGFVGETGWEIHCPSECAEDLWSALLEAGQEFGIRPFGVEAQRLLRLEKRHVIVGVDTDALTGPYESGMGWAAKAEKEDYSGKLALTIAAAGHAPEKLVGFVIPGDAIPEDGAAIVIQGKPAGRVTSSRYSPGRAAGIGLAWVPREQAVEGTTIQIRIQGKLEAATVTMEPFYDPEGLRLRM